VQIPIEVGIFPVSELNDKSKRVMRAELDVIGIFPLSLLLPTENERSFVIDNNIVDGKVPVNLLELIVSATIFVNFTMVDGIVPDKILFPNKSEVNAVIPPISVGMVPLKLFDDKSTLRRLEKEYFNHDSEPVSIF